MKQIKIQPRFKYDGIIFTDKEALKEFLSNHEMELLDLRFDNELNVNIAYYINQLTEADSFDFEDGWYIWIDEFGTINTASPDYIKENFNIIDSDNIVKFGNIISLKR